MKKVSKTDSLLVEIRCEELPPAVLWSLADSFPDSLLCELQAEGFADSNSHRAKEMFGDPNVRRAQSGRDHKQLATPRRFAALLQNIRDESPPREFFRRGPKLSACKDKDGRPTKALVGFMQSVGATCENDLEHAEEKGNQYVAWRGKTPGRFLADCLSALVEKVLLNLPAPRRMRWGDNDFKFIRPIRGLLMQHGKKTLRGNVMSVPASAYTVGHPTLSPDKIKIPSADDYESILRDSGKVQANMYSRLEMIHSELTKKRLGVKGVLLGIPSEDGVGSIIPIEENWLLGDSPLLREVTAMCEWPVCHWRRIDKEFMPLPQECIIACMKQHQKLFPFAELADQRAGDLLRDYCLVADNRPADAEAMLRDYDSVLRARLRDVQFYYAEDKKIPLIDCVEKLKSIVYHRKLGSQHDRIARICKIAAAVISMVGVKAKPAEIKQTAEEFLAPLSTLMCGEYPKLQEYLAEQYFGGGKYFHWIYYSYYLEELAAMFGVGEIPTGSKDPKGLRRAALIIAEACAGDTSKPRYILPSAMRIRPLGTLHSVDMKKVIAVALESFDSGIVDRRDEIYDFILERIRSMFLSDPNLRAEKATVESVLSQKPVCFSHVRKKIMDVRRFLRYGGPNVQAIIAADKRIKNIFRKSGKEAEGFGAPDSALFSEDAESELWDVAQKLRKETDQHLQGNNFVAALESLVYAAEPLEKFFNEVMVNAEDEKIRANRFALLAQFSILLNRVADLSFLSSEPSG